VIFGKELRLKLTLEEPISFVHTTRVFAMPELIGRRGVAVTIAVLAT
jgi:hypothetical protein